MSVDTGSLLKNSSLFRVERGWLESIQRRLLASRVMRSDDGDAFEMLCGPFRFVSDFSGLLLSRLLHRLTLLQQEGDQVRQVLFADLLDDVGRHW
jgi:hypothetical protein